MILAQYILHYLSFFCVCVGLLPSFFPFPFPIVLLSFFSAFFILLPLFLSCYFSFQFSHPTPTSFYAFIFGSSMLQYCSSLAALLLPLPPFFLFIFFCLYQSAGAYFLRSAEAFGIVFLIR